MNSIITSIFGVLSAIGGLLIAIGYPEYGGPMIAVGTGGIGAAARDNNKSSEDVGAKN